MENQDSVCYISKITSIVPIEGADKIELATVDGWTSVVAKGYHKVGNPVLCITTDAIIPDYLAMAWGVKDYLRRGNRVKTVRLKGVYSEAILIPLYDVPHAIGAREGDDFMSNLGIFKYEESISSENELYNRNFSIYYKFPNIKNVPNIFNEDDDIIITRKIHGMNARYGIVKKSRISFWDKVRKFFGSKDITIDYEFMFGSHKALQNQFSIWNKVNLDNDIENKLWNLAKGIHFYNELGKGVILYGEIYGPEIQGKLYHYNEENPNFRAFDIEVNGKYINREQFDKLVPTLKVPILYRGKWSKEIQDYYTNSQYITGSIIPHEGIVISHISGDRKKIAKVINPEYKIYSEKHNVPDGH